MIKNQQILLQYATKKQATKLKALWKYGSTRKAAKIIGVSHQSISVALQAVKTKANAQSIAQHVGTEVPEGYHIKGTSALLDEDDNIKQRWVKTDVDKENTIERLRLATQVFCDEARNLAPYIPAPKINNSDLLSVIPIADLHFGMYSWKEETGADYNCAIAENIVIESIQRIIDSAPNAESCLIASLGDWFHSDTEENRTMRSEHILDVDTRWQKVFKLGVKLKKTIIELALTKFNTVYVTICKGNHDDHTSYALSLIMQAYFQNEPRVIIDDSVAEFRYHKFGNNLLGMNHGIAKMDRLPGIMACDRSKDWGDTEHRLWLIGHKHKSESQEYPGCVVERFRTLAAKDAWTINSGYRSTREIQRLDLHKKFGLIERSIVGINQI